MNLALKSCLLWLLLAASNNVMAAQLGRLFFTPEQRMQLERHPVQDSKPPASTPPATINGIVQKQGGGQTVWIDGVPSFTGNNAVHPAESPFAIAAPPLRGEIKTGE